MEKGSSCLIQDSKSLLRFKLQIKKLSEKKNPIIFQKLKHEKLNHEVKQKETLNWLNPEYPKSLDSQK